jgi:hypothetical protein
MQLAARPSIELNSYAISFALVKGYGTQRLRTLDSDQVSTRALIITALVTGLAILVAFAVQVLIAI